MMKGFTRKLAATLVLSMAVPLAAAADELVSAANDMCAKVKSCALAQVAESDMTPEMHEMMEPMLQSMCDQMQQGVEEVSTGHPLYVPATACMRSMEKLSCADLQSERTGDTPECKQYRRLAEN